MEEPTKIQPETPANPVTVDLMSAKVRMFIVSEERLDMLGSGYTSLNMTFFGIAFGAALALGVPLKSGDISGSWYISAFLVSAASAVYLLIKTILDIRNSKKQVAKIKTESVATKWEFLGPRVD